MFWIFFKRLFYSTGQPLAPANNLLSGCGVLETRQVFTIYRFVPQTSATWLDPSSTGLYRNFVIRAGRLNREFEKTKHVACWFISWNFCYNIWSGEFLSKRFCIQKRMRSLWIFKKMLQMPTTADEKIMQIFGMWHCLIVKFFMNLDFVIF